MISSEHTYSIRIHIVIKSVSFTTFLFCVNILLYLQISFTLFNLTLFYIFLGYRGITAIKVGDVSDFFCFKLNSN